MVWSESKHPWSSRRACPSSPRGRPGRRLRTERGRAFLKVAIRSSAPGGWIMGEVWLSAARPRRSGARRSRYCRAGAKARHRRPRSSLVWRGPALSGARRGRFRAVWRGVCGATSARAAAGPSTRRTPLSGCTTRNAGCRSGRRWRRGRGRLRRRGDVATAFRASPARSGLKGIVDLRPGEPEAGGTQGTAAGRKEASRASRAGSHGGRPERDDGQRLPRGCGGARGCPRSVVAKDALLADGGASYPPCAAALEPRNTQPLDGFGAICMCRR